MQNKQRVLTWQRRFFQRPHFLSAPFISMTHVGHLFVFLRLRSLQQRFGKIMILPHRATSFCHVGITCSVVPFNHGTLVDGLGCRSPEQGEPVACSEDPHQAPRGGGAPSPQRHGGLLGSGRRGQSGHAAPLQYQSGPDRRRGSFFVEIRQAFGWTCSRTQTVSFLRLRPTFNTSF